MGDTLLLAAINAGLPLASSIDWGQEARQRFEIERSIYSMDSGGSWKQHDPWGPFFPPSAKTWEGQESAFEGWTRQRAEALPKNFVISSSAALRIDDSHGSNDIDVESDLPAVLPDVTLSNFFVHDWDAGLVWQTPAALSMNSSPAPLAGERTA